MRQTQLAFERIAVRPAMALVGAYRGLLHALLHPGVKSFFRQCAVQPPSIGNTASVIEAAVSVHRNFVKPATYSAVTDFFVGCEASSTLRRT